MSEQLKKVKDVFPDFNSDIELLNAQIKETAQELFTLMDESKELEDKVRDILRKEFE